MWLIIIASLIGLSQGMNWTDPVSTSKGLIRGLFADDGDYSMYLGIPYAKVDKKNPFGISKPQPKFKEIFDAIDDTAICPQPGIEAATLDCLHLNIYVPNNQKNLPVLVWIHGGAFLIGSAGKSNYGPKFLIRHGVILVTLNYRLGPYGFMCLDTEQVPGNQGVRDQYLALKWIHENIASFGGDVDKITVMGESAGSMSLELLMMSDLPKFYKQVILQSGSGLIPRAIILSNNTVPVRIAKHLGHTTDDMNEALTFLARAPINSVLNATFALHIELSLCVEKKFNNVERFLSIHPEHSHKSDIDNMSIMAGFNSHEFLAFFMKTPIEYTGMTELFFRQYISQDYATDGLDSMINKVRRFYIGDEKIKESLNEELIEFTSDLIFNHPIQRAVIKYLESGAKVYQYMFSYNGHRNFLKELYNIEAHGAAHSDELGYLFDIDLLRQPPTIEDQLMIDRMTTMWTNFVKYGNPTPTTSEVIPMIWTPASKDVIKYMDINSNLTTSTRPYHDRMAFWDLFISANRDRLWANNNNTTSSSSRIPSSVLYFFMVIILCLLGI